MRISQNAIVSPVERRFQCVVSRPYTDIVHGLQYRHWKIFSKLLRCIQVDVLNAGIVPQGTEKILEGLHLLFIL